MPVEYRNSWVRDWTCATAVTQAAEWQRLILNPLHHKGTPVYFFNIYVPNWSNFSSAVCASDVIINKWLLNPISWSFSSVFSYKNFIILALIFFDPFWIYFCTWHKNPNSFFCNCIQHHLLKRLSFPHWMVLTPLWKVIWSYT